MDMAEAVAQNAKDPLDLSCFEEKALKLARTDATTFPIADGPTTSGDALEVLRDICRRRKDTIEAQARRIAELERQLPTGLPS